MKISKIILILAALILITSCSGDKVKVAVTKASGSESYENYTKWIRTLNPGAEIIDMHGLSFDSALVLIEECDGIVLSGGPDIHPGYFGKAGDSARCSIDPYRDTLEMSLIEAALEQKMPILAICRGMQILNVALGGTLIIDIPEDHPNPETHQIDDGDAMHMVRLNKNSMLFKLAKIDSAEVNSNHHQAVDILADNLTASAVSRDGIVEAFEYADYENMPFMIGVQWHPERLGHPDLSDAIGRKFLKEASEFKKIRK